MWTRTGRGGAGRIESNRNYGAYVSQISHGARCTLDAERGILLFVDAGAERVKGSREGGSGPCVGYGCRYKGWAEPSLFWSLLFALSHLSDVPMCKGDGGCEIVGFRRRLDTGGVSLFAFWIFLRCDDVGSGHELSVIVSFLPGALELLLRRCVWVRVWWGRFSSVVYG